jgi:hypothetical protein
MEFRLSFPFGSWGIVDLSRDPRRFSKVNQYELSACLSIVSMGQSKRPRPVHPTPAEA